MIPAPRPLMRASLAVLALSVVLLAGCGGQGSPLSPAVTTPGELAPGTDLAATIESESDDADEVPSWATPIHGPTIIDAPGVYKVVKDIGADPATGVAITIRASGVLLSLGGHTLTGPGNKQGRAIVIENARHVRVANGRIERFGVGVEMNGVEKSAVRGLWIRGGDETADPANGNPPQIGVMLVNSAFNRVARVEARGVNLGLFIRGEGSYSNVLRRNTVVAGDHGLLAICYNPAAGAGQAGPQRDLVERNRLSRFGIGIQTSAGSQNNVFRRNVIDYFVAPYEDLNGTNVFRDNVTQQLTR